MFSKHVTSLSSSYFHDELTLSESQRVAKHLLSCTRCRADFDEAKLGARLAEQLRIVSAADSDWAGLVAQLDHKAVARGHRGRKPAVSEDAHESNDAHRMSAVPARPRRRFLKPD